MPEDAAVGRAIGPWLFQFGLSCNMPFSYVKKGGKNWKKILCLLLSYVWVLLLDGSWDSLLVRAPDIVIKQLRVQILAGVAIEFSSPESTLCADSSSVSIPPLCYRSGMLKSWLLVKVSNMSESLFTRNGAACYVDVKDPGHSAKSAGGRLHLNTHTPLTCWTWSGLTMSLSRQSGGIYQKMSSHAFHQGTLGHSRLGSLSHCGLILA